VPADASNAVRAPVVTVGGVYRHSCRPGLWKVVEACGSDYGNVWCLPCGVTGEWDRTAGWHAFREEDLMERPKVRTKRQYKRRTDG